MSRVIEILAVDWVRLRAVHPDRDPAELVAEALRRGRAILSEEAPPDVPPDGPHGARLAWLRRWFPRKAASLAVQRFLLATGRARSGETARRERESFERHLELDREVVPPLKEEAKALRAEVRFLEEELRRRGVDPDTIEPHVDWSRTMTVDDYARPKYVSNQERRRAAVDFFRRLG